MFRNFVDGLHLTSDAVTRNILIERSEALLSRIVRLCRELHDRYSKPAVLERLLGTCNALKYAALATEEAETDAAYLKHMGNVRKRLISIDHYLQLLKAINYISPKAYHSFYSEIEEIIVLTDTVSKPNEFKTAKGLVQWEEIHLKL